MFQCNTINLGVKGYWENHWSVEIICTANMRLCIVQIVSFNEIFVFNIKGPPQPVCFAGVESCGGHFHLYRNCSSQSPGYFWGFSALCERVRVRCVKKSLHLKSSICICVFFLLWSVSGRMSRSPPKRGRPPRNEKDKTILLRESTLKPKEMLLLFINECQLNFWNQVFIEAIMTWPGKNTLQT